MRKPLLATAALLFALGGGGATWAADNTAPSAQPAANQPVVGNAPASTLPAQSSASRPEVGTATINPTGIPPSQRNPLLADNSDVRIGKLIGTNVYNKNDKKIGSVDDVLAGQDGQLQVVIATGDKKVLVPWNKLQFGDAKLNSDNKVLMSDETQSSLNKMPTFTYLNQKKG